MKPFFLSLTILVVLLSAIASMIDVRSDADAVLGAEATGVGSLESLEGRSLSIALFSPDISLRNSAAREIAALLRNEELVAKTHIGPEPFTPALLDWVWERRFRLSPPQSRDVSVEQLSKRLAEARAELARGTGIVVGDRLLRDPTGSFAELMVRLQAAAHVLPQQDGIWQSRDNTAAILFVTLADEPFDAKATNQLVERLQARAEQSGLTMGVLGARAIAAQVSTRTTQAATFAALLAAALVLLWLIWILRSARKIVIAFLPLALGVASATLAVQLSFGSVHVIALGFGGALTGLALDYPLHLLSHGDDNRNVARRLILIGAATTAAGFGALLGSGLTALMQVGLFVAVGLGVAALASRLTISGGGTLLHALPMERLIWRLPFKAWVETVALVLGVVVVVTATSNPDKALFEQDADVRQMIVRFAPLLPLPSGQHRIVVQAETFDQLLSRESVLHPVLETAVAIGALERYAMAGQLVAADASSDMAQLPTSEAFRSRVERALRDNGMSPSFSSVQADEYQAALDASEIEFRDLTAHPELRSSFGRLEQTAQGWQEKIDLFGLNDAALLSMAIEDAHIPGITMIDVRGQIESELAKLRQRVGVWLGIGAIVSFAVLIVGLRDGRRALAIARTTAAATSVTAACLVLIGGGVGVFQIVALTLVVGIGIDYGLFLSRSDKGKIDPAHCRSVALCAGSTLVAFAVMGLTSVRILQDVGLAVSLGVVVVLVLNLAQPWRLESGLKNKGAK